MKRRVYAGASVRYIQQGLLLDQDTNIRRTQDAPSDTSLATNEETSFHDDAYGTSESITQRTPEQGDVLSTIVAEPVELAEAASNDADDIKVTNRILTVANIVSLIRMCLIPVFLVLLLDGHNYLATFVFALSAGTDFIDGYIARSTDTVSRLGRVLDPAVDRLLMIFGVAGLYIIGRLPLWIIAVVFIRDVTLLCGGFYFLSRYHVRPKVVFLGKVVTTFFFIGFGGLLLNWPQLQGLGIVSTSWLPGLNAATYSWGIWFVYLGLILGLFTTIYYIVTTLMKAGAAKAKRERSCETAMQNADETEDNANTE